MREENVLLKYFVINGRLEKIEIATLVTRYLQRGKQCCLKLQQYTNGAQSCNKIILFIDLNGDKNTSLNNLFKKIQPDYMT